jgi:hypothetical protein
VAVTIRACSFSNASRPPGGDPRYDATRGTHLDAPEQVEDLHNGVGVLSSGLRAVARMAILGSLSIW